MGEAARAFAQEALSSARMVQQFEAVLGVAARPATAAGR
jgi:hypothetical protein